MLNFIYYPVSGILLVWHKVFGFLLGSPNSGFAWALSVLFLVCTLRALLIKPFIGQVRSMRKMQEFQPQIKKLQEKYKGDRQKLAEEMQKLQKEHGVSPLGGCLPALVQVPVFIGLFHVLRGFQPNYPNNYFFGHDEILSFLDADIFGVRLSDSIAGGAQALGHFSLSNAAFAPQVLPVALPLILVASVATHFTARVSQAHQSQAAAANPQAAIFGKLTMWVFPLGILVFGAFLPIAILLYWLSNNTWTLAQQYLVYRKINREEAAMREQAREQRDLLAPRPGQKPTRPVRAGAAVDTLDRPADARDALDAAPGDGTALTPKTASADGTAGRTAAGATPASGGRRHPGKVAGPNGATSAAAKGSGGPGGRSGGGSGRSPGKAGGKGASGQVTSSARPGKRSKKRR